jgi:hypothetical protein
MSAACCSHLGSARVGPAMGSSQQECCHSVEKTDCLPTAMVVTSYKGVTLLLPDDCPRRQTADGGVEYSLGAGGLISLDASKLIGGLATTAGAALDVDVGVKHSVPLPPTLHCCHRCMQDREAVEIFP